MIELLKPFRYAPKKDPLDFKVHVSLCIFRSIQNHVLNSYIQLLCVNKPIMSNSNAMGDALIDRARSREASDFLNYTDADVLFMCDDDISFDVKDAVKICRKANELKGIVAATCVIKREEGSWIASKPLNSDPIVFAEDSPLVEVSMVGAGMVAIHRQVFLDILEHEKLTLCHPSDLKFWPFFQPMVYEIAPGEPIYASEDWAFCIRAKNSGHKIWLDPSTLSVTHYGNYGYKITDLLRQPRPTMEQVKSIKYEDVPGKLVISKDDGVRLRPELVR